MGRTARDNRDLPHPRPVQKIQLSEDHARRRLIAVVLLLLLGGAALAYGVFQLLTPESGWQAIKTNASAGVTCADEFVFLYELGSGGAAAQVEGKAVAALYSQACRKAYQLFSTVESFEDVTSLRDLNLHPNETLTVDDALYQAFEAVQRHGDRTIYLGPVYARYGSLFYCEDDVELVDFDPYLSDEVREEYGAYAAFARDPGAIDLRLLGGNQMRLEVSEEYLAFAQQEGVERFLDFGWLRNAFVVDYLADLMAENGYTHGTISSLDGFSRNLDGRELTYSQNVFDLADDAVYLAGTMEYRGPMSIVYLRDYPLNDTDSQWIYQLKGGELRTNYLSPEDGLCKSAVHDLICYSETVGCAEVALQVASIYVAETLDIQELEALAETGIHSIRCEDRAIMGTDPGLTVTKLYDEGGVRYTCS